jgi:hypothetical protein
MSTMGDEKDELIGSLQEEVRLLRRQVGEFNNLHFSVVKVTGKNSIRKLKMKVLTSSDKLNAHEIDNWLCESLWPHVKMIPDKWHKWSEHPKSICQCIMSVVGVPKGCTMEEYWLSVARTASSK